MKFAEAFAFKCGPSNVDRDHRLSPGRRPVSLIYRLICVDEDTMLWPAEDLGNLRVSLDAPVRVLRLGR